MTLQLLYVPTPSAAVADELSRGIVTAGLAACANVLPAMRSTYMWEGKVEVSEECLLLVKTMRHSADDAARWLEEHHPYETPCVLQLPVDRASDGFLAWVSEQVSATRSG